MGVLSDLIKSPLYAFIALMVFIIIIIFIVRLTSKSNMKVKDYLADWFPILGGKKTHSSDSGGNQSRLT